LSGRSKAFLTAAVLAGAGAGVFALLRPGAEVSTGPGAGGLPHFTPGQPGEVQPASPAALPVEQQVATLMASWRGAILSHDADTVMMCDRTFLGEPRTFTPALLESAQHDGDERVRAFSTRVLGKFEDASLIDGFRKLLEDKSPFVRENAAWGLGQLEARASNAAGDLEKVRRSDKADSVRRAADEALQRLRGSKRRAG
jgi:hypothetical protein